MARHPGFALTIDNHGNAGDGMNGRYGTCSLCRRTNKVVGPLSAPTDERRCVMPRLVGFLPVEQRPETGCDAQRGPLPMRGAR